MLSCGLSLLFNRNRFHFFWVSLVAQSVKYLSRMWETWVWSLGWEDPTWKMFTTKPLGFSVIFLRALSCNMQIFTLAGHGIVLSKAIVTIHTPTRSVKELINITATFWYHHTLTAPPLFVFCLVGLYGVFSCGLSLLFNRNRFHFFWVSLVAQTVKCLSTMRETWVRSLGWEDPLEKEMAFLLKSLLPAWSCQLSQFC